MSKDGDWGISREVDIHSLKPFTLETLTDIYIFFSWDSENNYITLITE